MNVVAIAALASLGLLPAAGAHAAATPATSVAARSDASSNPEPPLADTHWVIESVVTGDTVTDVPDLPEAYLVLHSADGSLDAYNGCNWIVGSAEIGDAVIRFDGVGMTKRACPDTDPVAEMAIFSALSNGDVTFEIDGDLLELTRPDGPGLRLRSQR